MPGPADPHAYDAATTDSCAGCHRTHTASGIVLRQMWPEENVCFSCHTSGASGTDVQPAFTSYANTTTRFFKHDVAATNGVHRVGQTAGTDFGGANRHVECEDCHEPHEATRGPASAPMLQRVMNLVSGVEPAWAAPGAPAFFTWLPQAEREYQVCFKCHSSFTTLPTYTPDGWDGSSYVTDGLRKLTSTDPNQVPDSRDLAQEFNPYNDSFHPVAAQGQNQSMPAGGFVAGWSQTSLVYCTDCHSNANSATEGEGPHGSPLVHLLVGAPNNGGQQDYTTQGVGTANNTSDQALCFKCHDAATYLTGAAGTASNTNFIKGANRNLHGYHMARDATCYACHDTHGSEQQHLINFELTTAPDGGLQPAVGYDSQSAWFPISGGWFRCALTCHGTNHTVINLYRYP
ncbi:MAG: hypothetical protein KKA73_12225 [Chloroflexi bacterium]|nr:hypothetical protein [Chloroflexota bacterium]MBU1748448.1 hypothetical protein [Chloroflexota bacterium]